MNQFESRMNHLKDNKRIRDINKNKETISKEKKDIKLYIKAFKDYFIGRDDVYGLYNNQTGKAFQKKAKLSDSVILNHLTQKHTIGSYYAYKIDGQWYCKFICIDFDGHKEDKDKNDITDVNEVKEEFDSLSLKVKNFLIENFNINKGDIFREFSGRGYHIWIKLNELTPLKIAFNFTLEIKKEVKENLDYELEEIFPKQAYLKNIEYGNFVKLPLSLNRNNNQFCEILDDYDITNQNTGHLIKLPLIYMRKPVMDMINGVFELEEYSKKAGKKEHLYWKLLFNEAWHYCRLESYELYPLLEKNQKPSFDKAECEEQLKHDYHNPKLNKPFTNKKLQEMFPDYNNQNITINNTGIILDDLGKIKSLEFDKTSILQEVKNIPAETTDTNRIFQIFRIIPEKETGVRNEVINLLSEKLNNFGKRELNSIVKEISSERRSETEEDFQKERIIANDILNQNIIYTLRETDELCLYKDGCFIYGKEVIVIIRMQITEMSQFIEDYEETKAKRSMIFEFIKTQSFVSVNDFDCNDNIVNLRNGLYNFKNNQFIPHDSSNKYPYKSFIQIPVEYNPEAKCPTIGRFIIDVFGVKRVSLIIEWFAYLIMNTVKYHKALMLYGPTDTGETTFLHLTYAFLGRKHISEISLQDLWRPFQITHLRDTLANIHDDLDAKKITYIGMFKKIVTNKYLSGEIKNIQDYIAWINRTKLMFACNRLPFPKDVGDDFWRRWIPLSCFNQFIKGVNRDSNMLEKITTTEELSGLFNNIINGWERLEERKGFPSEWDDIEHIKNIWLMDINPVSAFVNEYCNLGNPEYKIDYEDFYKKVCEYRKNHKVDEITKNLCSRSLGRIDERIIKKKVNKKHNPNSSGYKYIYIEFKEDVNEKREKKQINGLGSSY